MAKPHNKLKIAYPDKEKPAGPGGTQTSFKKRLPVVFTARNLRNKKVCLAVIKNVIANDATTDFVSDRMIVPLIEGQERYMVHLPLKTVAEATPCHLFACILNANQSADNEPKNYNRKNCPRTKVIVSHA